MELISNQNLNGEVYSFSYNNAAHQLTNFHLSGEGLKYKHRIPLKGQENARYSQIGIGNYEYKDDKGMLHSNSYAIIMDIIDQRQYFISMDNFRNIFINA